MVIAGFIGPEPFDCPVDLDLEEAVEPENARVAGASNQTTTDGNTTAHFLQI